MKSAKTINTVLAALAIVSGFAVWYFDILSKELSVTLISTTSLGSTDVALFQSVKLTVADNQVSKPQLAIVRVSNTGFKEVRTSDFETTPIVIDLASSGKIIAAAPAGSNREQLQVAVKAHDGKAEIAPLLLNRGDAVSVALLVDGERPQFKVAARVAGVPELVVDISDPQQKKDNEKRAGKLMVMISSFVLFLFVFVFYNVRSSDMESLVFPPRPRHFATLVILACAICPLVVVLNEFDMSIGRHSIVEGAWILGLATFAGALAIWRRISFGTHEFIQADMTVSKMTEEP